MATFANLDSAEDQLHQSGTAPALVEQLMAEARDALTFTRRMMAEADVPLGSSKLGGAPDLSAGADWPARAAGIPFSDLLAKATCPVFRPVGAMATFTISTALILSHPATLGRSGPPASRPDPICP